MEERMNTVEICVEAYAKINLTLDVLGKRPDGYHQVETILQSVGLRDRVLVRRGGTGIQIRCGRAGVPCDQRNTAYRAAEAFFRVSGLPPEGLEIEIQKRIPMEAGLAGGSADAAAVLLAMDRLFQTGLDDETLCQAALQVGADVPFCLTGGTMLGEETGGVLTPLAPLPSCCLLLAKPWGGVPTAAAYAAVDNAPVLHHPHTARAAEALAQGDLHRVASLCANVFEEVLRREDVRRIRGTMMEHGAMGACMSGSGPTVFGFFDSVTAAKHCRRALESGQTEVFLCEPVARGCLVAEA